MTELQNDKKDEEATVEKTEEENVKEDKEKALDSSISALVDTIKALDISGLKTEIKGVAEKVDKFDARIKALETPTDLPAKPQGSAEDDIGAKIKAPDTYQSNSQQASIRDSDPENSPESDKGKLSMQEKSLSAVEKKFTTETPRPNSAIEAIQKSGIESSPLLKAAREVGFDGLSTIAHRINKGEFGQPEQSEVALW